MRTGMSLPAPRGQRRPAGDRSRIPRQRQPQDAPATRPGQATHSAQPQVTVPAVATAPGPPASCETP
jgi:hypothetical protein